MGTQSTNPLEAAWRWYRLLPTAAVIALVISETPNVKAQVVVIDTVEVVPAPDPSAEPVVKPVPRRSHLGPLDLESLGGAVGTRTLMGVVAADGDGVLKVRYIDGFRPDGPYAASESITVEPAAGAALSDNVLGRFGAPLALPTCGQTGYYYGDQAFEWYAPNDPASVKDTRTFSIPCSSSYGTFSGRCESVPEDGGHRHLPVYAWTWRGTFGTHRSFVRFDLPALPSGPELTAASLALYPAPDGIQYSPSGADGIDVRLLGGTWDEFGLTHLNQPPAGGLVGTCGPGSGGCAVNITGAVRGWLDGSIPNHGLRLSLQTESRYRSRTFSSADGAYPPELELTYQNLAGAGGLATFGSVADGDVYTVRYKGLDASAVQAFTLTLNGEQRAGHLHTFVVPPPVATRSGSICGQEELRVFSFVSPEAAAAPVLAFERASDGAPVDPETYLPIKDDEIVVTATVAGAADGDVRFELAGTNGGAPYEFAFAVGGSPTTSAQVVPVASDGTAAVTAAEPGVVGRGGGDGDVRARRRLYGWQRGERDPSRRRRRHHSR